MDLYKTRWLRIQITLFFWWIKDSFTTDWIQWHHPVSEWWTESIEQILNSVSYLYTYKPSWKEVWNVGGNNVSNVAYVSIKQQQNILNCSMHFCFFHQGEASWSTILVLQFQYPNSACPLKRRDFILRGHWLAVIIEWYFPWWASRDYCSKNWWLLRGKAILESYNVHNISKPVN